MNKEDDFKPSRRAALKAGLAAAGFAALAVASARRAAADDSNKVAKEAVQYQDQPKDGNKCSGCVNFQAPNACVIVAGNISPNGWCLSYAPKES